jgi:hypothetical protein
LSLLYSRAVSLVRWRLRAFCLASTMKDTRPEGAAEGVETTTSDEGIFNQRYDKINTANLCVVP